MTAKRPWEEETWTWDRHDASERFTVRSADGREVLEPSTEAQDADLDIASAAPDMARAILANGYVRNMGDGLWHTDACNEMNDGSNACGPSCEQARAALRKAGVL